MKYIVAVVTNHGVLASYIKETEDEARALRERIGEMGIWGKEYEVQLLEARLIDKHSYKDR